MDFLKLFLRGVALLPTLIQGIETLFGEKAGLRKREAALSIASAAIRVGDAMQSKAITDADGFIGGLGQIVDGMVACLNASIWAKR